jgi:hypothetical protein
VSLGFTLDCPECDLVTAVDADIRAEILDAGCVICRAPVSADAFSRSTGPDPDATP